MKYFVIHRIIAKIKVAVILLATFLAYYLLIIFIHSESNCKGRFVSKVYHSAIFIDS